MAKRKSTPPVNGKTGSTRQTSTGANSPTLDVMAFFSEAPRFSQAEINDRISKIADIYVDYAETDRVRKELAARLAFGTSGPSAQLTLFVAPSGTGKTSIIYDFVAQVDRLGMNELDHPKILRVALPVPCTIKGMTEEILEELGDPLSHHNSTAARNSNRIVRQLSGQNVKLIIIDEFQHLIDHDRDKVLRVTTDWLKSILDRAGIPVICVGLPNSIDIIRSNPQIERRTTRLIEMQHFAWSNKAKITEFRAFLHLYESKLPFTDPSNLSAQETAEAVFIATDGLIGRISQLILEAARTSMLRPHGPDAITIPDLADAYNGLPFKGYNPFIEDPGRGPPVSAMRAINPKAGPRRSNARNSTAHESRPAR